MSAETLKLILAITAVLIGFCCLLNQQAKDNSPHSDQFVYMDLMVIDERGRSIHGASLKLDDTNIGTTDSHGRWAKMVKIPLGQLMTLTAQKTRMGTNFQHIEKIQAHKKNLVENEYRLTRVVQVREEKKQLF